MTLILASQSPRRAELLGYFNLPFTVSSADIDETRLPDEAPIAMTERLAIAKAQCILRQSEDVEAWVLGGDTTVALGVDIFGKPTSKTAAIETLRRLSGNSHEVISSVCLASKQHTYINTVVSKVTFGDLKPEWIAQYCEGDEPWDKAGSYGIQGAAGVFVERIEGDYSAIVGLPLWATGSLLVKAGLR